MAQKSKKTKKICIGDKVLLENNMKGEVRFIGSVSGKPGTYYGIKLTQQTGKNNGCISDVRYFECNEDYGLFVSRSRIKKTKVAISEAYKNLPRVEIGDKIVLRAKKLYGIIRFIGSTHFEPEAISYGIELDEAKGSSSGVVDKRQYFECKSQCGVFLGGSEIIVCKPKKKRKSSKKKRTSKTLHPRNGHNKNKSQTIRNLKISPNSPALNKNRYRYPSPTIVEENDEPARYQTETNRAMSLLLVYGYCHMLQNEELVTFFDVFLSPRKNHVNHRHYHEDKRIPISVIELCHAFLYDKIRVSDFKQLRLLGKGAFAEVRLVNYKKNDDEHQLYAMKSLSKKLMLKKKQEKQIFIERDILINLHHWLIIKLFWSFQDTKYLHLVEEFCQGGDLMTLLQDIDVLTHDEARFYMAEIAAGIHFLHENKYVHRDIKPENILLNKSGHIKLCDFGSAGFYDPDYFDNEVVPRKSRKNAKLLYRIVGTPDYVAPEILRKKGYGFECDWWSMGVIMFESLCGYPPFYAGSPKQTCRNILNYTKTLYVPSDADLSENAKNCILKLLCSWQRRITFPQLMKHAFFKNIPWDNLDDMLPPHPLIQTRTDSDLGTLDECIPASCTMLHYTRSGDMFGSGQNTPNLPRSRSRSVSRHSRCHFKGFTFEGNEEAIFGDAEVKFNNGE